MGSAWPERRLRQYAVVVVRGTKGMARAATVVTTRCLRKGTTFAVVPQQAAVLLDPPH